ncbi:hypothetical protein COB64_03945 [Candidatus Wolfebacteria bacterium]|nr:MAG: hypothetical protein COB64_03945 [Candidatus Wolfebacteria bacterium]
MVLGQVITTEDRKVFLLRTDINGDTIWSKIYGISPMIHFTGVGSSFIQTADNGFAFCGTIADSADSGLDDMLLMKFDSLGDTLWTKRFGGANQDIGQDCEQTTDGGYIIIGTTTSFGDTLGDIYLVKTDSIGNLEWDATYGEGNLDAGLSVSPTADGGYILGGSLSKNGEFIWVIKTDSIGDTLWTTAIDVNLDVGCFVEPSIDGGYIITTDKDNLTGNGKDGYIAKLDGVGAITWEHTYVGSSQNDWLSQVIELPDGSIVAAGQSRNDNNISSGWLLKVTPNGDSLWSRKFSVPDSLSQQFWSLRATLDGGFIMSGFAAAPTQDTWIVKTNCLGYDAPPQANFSSTSDTLTASFINQSQKAGTYLWDFGDGNSSTGSNPSHTYQDSGIYVVTLIAAACGDTSITFNIVQVSIPVGIQEGYAIDDNIQIYPNPTSGRINIIGLSSNEDITITVYNILGELLQKVQLNRLDDYLGDLENYPDGLYILLIEQNNKAYKKRVIKL